MKILKSVSDILIWRKSHTDVGFVPTMGALHAGHLALVERAKRECQTTLVSIFVNPTQFNNPKDLETYPQSLDEDLRQLEELEVDAVFLPQKEQLYPDNYRYKVVETVESKILCGAHRPGHFDGVLTIVLKLLMLAGCRRCYMGEKDYQQFRLVKGMAESFFLDVEIIAVPTVRENDGLALSSRNLLLSPEAREKAPLLQKALNNSTDVSSLEDAGFKLDYFEEHWGRKFIAAEIDGVRLIDNV